MDRRRRIWALTAALVLIAAALAVQLATADPAPSGVTHSSPEAYPGRTLITVQSHSDFVSTDGEAFIVDPSGEVVWRYDPPHSRVFDAEHLEDGNVMVSLATFVPAADCPVAFRSTDRFADHCVRNRVVELARGTDEIVWNYSWYDVYLRDHEVHDADRLPDGRTAIVDMGNDRAFIVDRSGGITWEWDAREHLGPGSDFWAEYVPAGAAEAYRPGPPESDWTHMNDIDVLGNGNVQLSVRNLDVVVEVDPNTDAVVGVVGRPGDRALMHEQHDPHRLEAAGTLLVADSEQNRVVELDVSSGEPVWAYTGDRRRLQWPRDADRLPNGNTLIVDSRGLRVIEVNATGEVVWEYSTAGDVGIVYDADRLGVGEEPPDAPGGTALSAPGHRRGGALARLRSWLPILLPRGLSPGEALTGLLGLGVAGWLGAEVALGWRRRSAG